MQTLATLLAFFNATRVVEDLHTLQSFGATGGGRFGLGVSRRALTEADVRAREWLASRFEDAGLRQVRLDGIGTVYGEGGSDQAPALLIGSHSDTQPQGGWLDGALGVIFGLEAARVLHQGGAPGAWALAAWQDEEGRFGSLTASSAFAAESGGLPTVHSHEELHDARLRAGLDGKQIVTMADRPAGWLGYMEAHIEQGPQLELLNKTVGIVSSIVGMRQLIIRCRGEQNHAGSTRMADRKDATRAAMRLSVAVDDSLRSLCEAEYEDECLAVWTFAKLTGFVSHSTIPGDANLTLQFRAPEEALLERMERLVRKTVSTFQDAATCDVFHDRQSVSARQMDPGLQACLTEAARSTLGVERVHHMHSAAIHDASPIASIMPASMLFVPSIEGKSHTFDEHTHEADIRDGARVFAAAVAALTLGHCSAEGLACASNGGSVDLDDD
jgi:N-carbamoyl-L-amino-acid hydrolase